MMVEDGKWMDFPDLWFGQTVTHTYKPGFLEAGSAHEWSVSAPTFEAMQADSDRGAAATAILVGTYMKVPLEPVIEAAVAVNRKVLLDVGPQPYNQAWRIKAVFLAAMDVANQLKARFAKNVANAFASILAKEQLDKNIAKVLANLTYVPPKVVVPASVVPPASSIRLEDRGATLLSRIRRLYPPTRKWL